MPNEIFEKSWAAKDEGAPAPDQLKGYRLLLIKKKIDNINSSFFVPGSGIFYMKYILKQYFFLIFR